MCVSFEFYRDTFKGVLPKEDFARLLPAASAYIEQMTFGRSARQHAPVIQEKVNKAICAIVDILHKHESDGGDITSQSVGLWSITFAKNDKNSIDTRLYETAQMYLAMTGLMYQGGGL